MGKTERFRQESSAFLYGTGKTGQFKKNTTECGGSAHNGLATAVIEKIGMFLKFVNFLKYFCAMIVACGKKPWNYRQWKE